MLMNLGSLKEVRGSTEARARIELSCTQRVSHRLTGGAKSGRVQRSSHTARRENKRKHQRVLFGDATAGVPSSHLDNRIFQGSYAPIEHPTVKRFCGIRATWWRWGESNPRPEKLDADLLQA